MRTGVVCVCWALPSTAGIWFVLSLWHRWKRRHWWKRVHESTWAQTDRDPGYSCHFLFSKRPFRCWIHSWQIFPPVSASELFEPAQHLGTVPPGLSPNVQTAIRNDVRRLRVPATQRTPCFEVLLCHSHEETDPLAARQVQQGSPRATWPRVTNHRPWRCSERSWSSESIIEIQYSWTVAPVLGVWSTKSKCFLEWAAFTLDAWKRRSLAA